MADLKKITDMLVARALDEDDHFFAEVSGKLSEVPLSLLMRTLVRRIDFPKGFVDVSDAYSQSDCQEPIDYLFDLPAGNYILNDMSGEYLNGTYQMSRFDGDGGNVSRWFIITTDHTHIELYSSKYSNDDPLLWLDGESQEFLFKGESIITRGDLDNAIRGIGITVVKESPESAELGANTYAASGDRLPVVVPAAQTADHRPVGKGSQIIFVPEHNNIGTDPMLTLNDGVAVPIRQRAAIDTQTADNTVQISANTLIQGMPYTLTFCGVAWLIDSYLPGEGSETTAKVTSVNNKTGAVKITASGIGAALASINWRSVTKSYLNAISNVENGYIDPKEFMLCFGHGCFFCRAGNGQHFLVRTDIGSTANSETASSGPAVVFYAHLPISGSNDVISGGLWIDNTKIAGIESLADLESLVMTLNGSQILTADELAERLKGYVSNTALSLLLGNYAPLDSPIFRGFVDVVTGAKASTKTRIFPNKIKLFSGAASATISSSFHNENNLLNLSGTNEEDDVIVRGVKNPLLNNDVANKSYVDAVFMAAADGRLVRAEYDVTSFSDIEEAFNAGKLIYLSYHDSLLFCYACGQGAAYFSSASTDYFVEVGVQGNESQTSWTVIGDGYVERKDNKVNSLTASVTHNQYPSAKATYEAIKALSDQIIWKDVTDEWLEFRDNNSAVAFVTAARSFVKEQADGRYCFTSEDGDVVHARIVTAGTGDTKVKYRIIWFAPHDAANQPSFEYWQNDKRLLGTSTGDGILRLEMLGKQVVFKDEFSAALAGLPSRESVENAIRTEVREVTSSYDQLSVVRTRLQKFKDMSHTIRVEIDNADKLVDEEDVILQLWVCSRKHGTAHHWWHPSQPGSPTRTSKIGYAMLSGDLIHQNRPLETARFPAVPAWMPNDGYVLTEIPVTAQDLKNGYVDINASTYFLPFVKPRGTTWKYKEVVMMFTQPRIGADKRYSVPVTWKVAVMRNGSYHQIGGAENVAKIGFRRYASGDLIGGTTKTKKLQNLHISIK